MYGKKQQYCVNCHSHDHNSKKSDQCPYWVGLATSTLIFNERFVRNKKIGSNFTSGASKMDTYWTPKNFEINFKNISNRKIDLYKRIEREKNLLLYLIIDNNIWGTEHEKLDIYNMFKMVYGKKGNSNISDNENENKNENKEKEKDELISNDDKQDEQQDNDIKKS